MSTLASTVVIAVLSGLTGAPHCLIMCGGIASSLAAGSEGSALSSSLAYNAGRILTYATVGAVMGAIGSFANVAGRWVGVQGFASIAGGAFILLWAFRRYMPPIHRLEPKLLRLAHSFSTTPSGHGQRQRRKQEKGVGRVRREWLSFFATGLMLGFLPCGLTYAMQIQAASTGSWLEGFIIMLAFGLSTFPILLITALSAGGIRKKWRTTIRRAGVYIAIVMGVLSIMKGVSANGWVPSVHPWLW